MTTAMIEGTPKTKAPTMVAAVVTPIRRLRACKAYIRWVTVTSGGAGSAATSVFSDMSVAASAHHGGVLILDCVCVKCMGRQLHSLQLSPPSICLHRNGSPRNQQRVHREGALTLRQHDHGIQVHFSDVVPKIMREPR